MSLLLCAATRFEINPTLDVLQQLAHQKVEVLITGVGLLAATHALTRHLCRHTPAVVIQAGVGGSFSAAAPVGAVVAINKDIVGDEGVWENSAFKNLASLGLQTNDFADTHGWLHNHHSILQHTGFPQAAAVTANTISTEKKALDYYKTLGATIESMEGAALHYVCLQQAVPFLQLRAVSNLAGERAKENWNLPLAVVNLNNALQQVINLIIHEKN